MSPALFAATLRERFTRPVTVALLLAFALMFVLWSLTSANQELNVEAEYFVLILSAGSIGRDISSGVIALILTRPITRASYLMTKWLALSTASTFVFLLVLGVQAIAVQAGLEQWLMAAFDGGAKAFGLTAVLVLLSSLVSGLGDLALWLILLLTRSIAARLHVVSQRVAEELQGLLLPKLEWSATFSSTPLSWFALVSYASTITGCLAAAIIVLNRKEISYASD
jgi:ABC-type transport system involved in multi-copper enzyme maturation permease subunit